MLCKWSVFFDRQYIHTCNHLVCCTDPQAGRPAVVLFDWNGGPTKENICIPSYIFLNQTLNIYIYALYQLRRQVWSRCLASRRTILGHKHWNWHWFWIKTLCVETSWSHSVTISPPPRLWLIGSSSHSAKCVLIAKANSSIRKGTTLSLQPPRSSDRSWWQ